MTTNRKIAVGALIVLFVSVVWTRWAKPFCDQWLLEREEKVAAKTAAQTKTTTLPRLPMERRWEPTVPVVVATPDRVSNPIQIPFGRDFWIDTKGNVFCFKNDKPFLWNGRHLILKPGDTGIPFGTDCQSLAFQSAEPNDVVVVVHLRDHQY